MKLVLVESPAKCAKIAEYLGAGFECIATMGHFRILPDLAHLSGFDDDEEGGNIIAKYEDKLGAPIGKLKSAIARASLVYLATDDDREGEAIAFHICDRFKLSPTTTPRIVFNEITKEAILRAVHQPRLINMPIVHAQQARQILDILIGFNLSPYLWRSLTQFSRDGLYVAKPFPGMSAGRCQSPTLRLIVENAEERLSSLHTLDYDENKYHLFGIFTPLKLRFNCTTSFTEQEIQILLTPTNSPIEHHWLPPSEKKFRTLAAPFPFTTCLFQQAMSNELHLSPKESMMAAQELYEAGLITYMRTDGTTYSSEFWKQIATQIPPEYLSDSNGHQGGAHEAIRVVDIHVKKTENNISKKAQRVYDKIWHRCIESCMKPAIFQCQDLNISSHNQDILYTYVAEIRHFPGWLYATPLTEKEQERKRAFEKYSSDATGIYGNPKYDLLEALQELPPAPLPYYTEAKVVSLLKERGIGRPSTYAGLLDKNIQRKYIEKQNIPGKVVPRKVYQLLYNKTTPKIEIIQHTLGEEKNKLVPTTLGKMVNACLYPLFESLLGYEYTQQMENKLDIVAQNQLDWTTICHEVYQKIQLQMPTQRNAKTPIKKSYPVEGGKFTYSIGKYGPVLRNTRTSAFVGVKATTIDLAKLERGEYTFAELIQPPEYKEQQSIEQDRRDLTPFLSIRKSKRGFYLFYQTPSMKKPQFYPITPYKLPTRNQSYLTCELIPLLTWIQQTYGLPT
jgi:DNA topoisomerase-1